MSVPPEDILCRLLDPGRWAPDEGRPSYLAFNASKDKLSTKRKLSTWHTGKISELGSELDDLCIINFDGYGHGLLSGEDFLQAAIDCQSDEFDPTLEWRPDEAGVAWARWAEAHVNIEAERGHTNFPKSSRLLLADRCDVVKRPRGI